MMTPIPKLKRSEIPGTDQVLLMILSEI